MCHVPRVFGARLRRREQRAHEAGARAAPGRRDEHVLERRERGEHRRRLQRARDAAVRHLDRPGVRHDRAGDHAQDGRLARAVRPDERGDAARLDRQRDVLGSGDVAERLAQPARVERRRGRASRRRTLRCAPAPCGCAQDSFPAERDDAEQHDRGEQRVRARRGDVLETADEVGGDGQHAEHQHPRRCAERRERAAEQHDDEETEREERPELCRVADARELHQQRTGDARDDTRRGDREHAQRAHGHAERERGGLALTRRSEAQPDRRACEREVCERGEAGQRERELVVLRGARPARHDTPLRAAEEPGDRLQAEGEEPRDDPRRSREPRRRQPREGGADERRCQAARDAARNCRDRRRRAPCEQMRRDDGSDRDEGALGERRQAGDPDRKREPNRGAREVEPVRKVRGTRLADDERSERRDGECRNRERHAWPPAGLQLVERFGERRHSTAACVSVRARQANSARPTASGSTSR